MQDPQATGIALVNIKRAIGILSREYALEPDNKDIQRAVLQITEYLNDNASIIARYRDLFNDYATEIRSRANESNG